MKNVVFQTESTRETIQLGQCIGTRLRPGDVVALAGELGSGKTHLIKGLAVGAGVRTASQVSSPSFSLVHEYPGKIPVYHLDMYRLETEREAAELGLEEYFQRSGLTVIEWADRIPSLLPKDHLCIYLCYRGERTRIIQLIGKGERFEKLVNTLLDLLRTEGFTEINKKGEEGGV